MYIFCKFLKPAPNKILAVNKWVKISHPRSVKRALTRSLIKKSNIDKINMPYKVFMVILDLVCGQHLNLTF